MDGALFKIAEKVKNSEVSDTCSLRLFFRNKQIMIDSGNGNSKDINWPLEDKQKMISIFETVYDEAKKDNDMVVLPQD
ncbi:unnamed protein product [Callosobruchus maculatus]|uniref:Uncharacterized protein n=1 Tax=Callosobruchus maculatus TaxID=64391 RepID=A0A653DMX6_CALMS|nr:unnamed protein product [Callosobruchus maculatus]